MWRIIRWIIFVGWKISVSFQVRWIFGSVKFFKYENSFQIWKLFSDLKTLFRYENSFQIWKLFSNMKSLFKFEKGTVLSVLRCAIEMSPFLRYGTKFLRNEECSWFLVPGSLFLVPGALLFLVPCSRFLSSVPRECSFPEDFSNMKTLFKYEKSFQIWKLFSNMKTFFKYENSFQIWKVTVFSRGTLCIKKGSGSSGTEPDSSGTRNVPQERGMFLDSGMVFLDILLPSFLFFTRFLSVFRRPLAIR